MSLEGSVSGIICAGILVGLVNRRRKRVHIPIMLGAFVGDLALVLYIELTRDAIATARTHMTTLMAVHVTLSVLVLALYVTQIVSGLKKALGGTKSWHGKTGWALLMCRLGNFITSLLVTAEVHSIG